MFTQLRNLADIASILGTPSTLGTPNTFGTHTPKSTVAEPGTPSDMDIASSRDNSPPPLLFHIDLQDDQKKSLPIPIPPSIKLPPLDDIFDYTPSDKPCYALTLPLGRGSQLGLGPRDNGQERNGLPDPGRGPKDR